MEQDSHLHNLLARKRTNFIACVVGIRHTINDKATTEPLRANIVISGEPIEQKKLSVRYLGAYIDNELKWKDHIKAVAPKVTRGIPMIRYTKTFIPIMLRNSKLKSKAPKNENQIWAKQLCIQGG